MAAYGIELPVPRSDSEVIAFLRKHSVRYDLLYRVGDTATFARMLREHSLALHTVSVYDRLGNSFQTGTGSACGYALTEFEKYPQRYVAQTARVPEAVYTQPYTLIDSFPENRYDYTMYMTWAMYAPKLDRAAFKTWSAEQSGSKLRIRYVLIDMDMPVTGNAKAAEPGMHAKMRLRRARER